MAKKNELILNAEQQEEIMRVLLIGLECFGEIERIEDEIEKLDCLDGDNPIAHEVRPIHPTGSFGSLKIFASALRDMQQV